jgi:hypothetical protein
MIDSRKLMLALIVLQIATVSLLLLTFFPPESDLPPGNTVATESGRIGQSQPLPMSALQAELRGIVREEIAAATGSQSTGEIESKPLSEEELKGREQAAAASGSLIHGAIAAGVWTRGDTQSLLPHIGRMSSEQRIALMEEFYGAINRQELQLEDIPPL